MQEKDEAVTKRTSLFFWFSFSLFLVSLLASGLICLEEKREGDKKEKKNNDINELCFKIANETNFETYKNLSEGSRILFVLLFKNGQ